MLRNTRLFTLFALAVGLLIAALPVFAVPGAFDFDTNPIPDGTPVDEGVVAGLSDPVSFVVNDAANATNYEWRLWYPGSDTTGAPDVPVNVADTTDPTTSIDVPLSAVGNALMAGGEGTYTWTIVAIDGNDGDSETEITGSPLTFTVDFWGIASDTAPADGATINAVPASIEFTMEELPTAYAGYEDIEFRIWAGNNTSGTPAVTETATGTPPGITVDTSGGLADGLYTWSIYAVDTNSSETETEVQIVEGFQTFTVDTSGAAGPGSFDFVSGNPVPDATTFTSELGMDVTFTVTDPADNGDTADDIVWYLWAGAMPGTTVDAATSIPLTQDSTTMEWSFDLPATAVNALADGTYSWDIIATDTSGQTSVDGAPFTFTIDFPAAIDVIYPPDGDTVEVPLESWVFLEVADADFYEIYIYSPTVAATSGLPAALPVSGFISAEEACADNGVCVVLGNASAGLTFGTAFNGDYDVYMRAYDLGTDTFTPTDYELTSTFTLNVPTTQAPVVVGLTDGDTVGKINEFVWEEDPAAQWYNLTLTSGGNTLVNEWVLGRDVCVSGECVVAAPTLLLAGSYSATFTAWGPGVTATTLAGIPNTTVNFTIDGAVADGIMLSSPVGSVVEGPSELTFNDNPNTYWYRIYVVNAAAGVTFAQWVQDVDICGNGVCSIAADLVPGDYQVWIRGYGPSNQVGPFTASTFTVTASGS